MLLEIHATINNSTVEGPYHRFVIWTQGCSIRCPHCANQKMWEPGQGDLVKVNTLFEKIMGEKDIEGITFLGGEPFDQAGVLAELAAMVCKAGLGVVTFTGYSYEYLIKQKRPDRLRLLQQSDLLIDGPFKNDLITTDLPWVGSVNQRYIHLSDRYRGFDFHSAVNKLEIRFDLEGSCSVNGLEDEQILHDIIDHLP